jgi:sulfite reductase (NADPH) flavoprotein alpha-component
MFLHALPARLDLSHSNIQVLGLGDRRYPLFCQFARQLEQALLERGAQLAWPLLTVDSLHPQDIAAWHASLTQRFSLTFSDTFATPDAFSATLVERICLNPDSTSPSLFLLRFSVHDARWQAGDTLRLRPFNNPQLAVREYSIANACGETLELIVRQAGQCSGWLCQTLAAGEQIVFQVCAKPDFYAVPDAPAILIGAGSGLAGLRGHLQARPAGSHNWLVFGERCPDTDRILAEEAENWLMGGHLQYLNLAFSRDPQQPAYVQDCLRKHQARLVEWLDNGAVLYLCGSLQGMGRSVESMLAELLGQKKFRALQQQGRYRADLY